MKHWVRRLQKQGDSAVRAMMDTLDREFGLELCETELERARLIERKSREHRPSAARDEHGFLEVVCTVDARTGGPVSEHSRVVLVFLSLPS